VVWISIPNFTHTTLESAKKPDRARNHGNYLRTYKREFDVLFCMPDFALFRTKRRSDCAFLSSLSKGFESSVIKHILTFPTMIFLQKILVGALCYKHFP